MLMTRAKDKNKQGRELGNVGEWMFPFQMAKERLTEKMVFE